MPGVDAETFRIQKLAFFGFHHFAPLRDLHQNYKSAAQAHREYSLNLVFKAVDLSACHFADLSRISIHKLKKPSQPCVNFYPIFFSSILRPRTDLRNFYYLAT